MTNLTFHHDTTWPKCHALRLLAALLLAFTCSGTSYAEQASTDATDVSQLKLKTERVVVFKDGYCLVVKQGTATTDSDGNVFTDEVPDSAVLGSFWVVPEKATIKATVAGWVDVTSETKKEVNCTNTIEMIKANLGKACSFQVSDERIEGTLLKILTNEDGETAATVAANLSASPQFISSHVSVLPQGSSSAAPHISTSFLTASGKFFLIRTELGDKMIAVNSIRNLTIDGMNSSIERTVTTKTKHKRLSMKFEETDTKVKINLMYFRPGIRWIPTYQLNLTDEVVDAKDSDVGSLRKKAHMIMQGELLNEAEDLTGVPIHVVVGVPNFRFRSTPSPMVLEGAMRNALVQAAPQIMSNGDFGNNFLSNAVYSQRAGEFRSNRASGSDARSTVNLPKELSGSGGNDLFVYELPPMDLMRGERALVPILSTEVEYRDIYTWDVELVHSESYAATSADSPSPLVLSKTKVWRQVELINNTKVPWTTGAAMLVDGVQPLAQELLTYTSPGGICRVPVTVSVDLRGKATDSEIERNMSALKWRGYTYAQVNGKVEAELANNKTYPVPVEVRLRLGGKARKASDDGKITIESYRAEDWRDKRGDSINNSSSISWQTTIEPGECFKPNVNYEFMIRR